MPDLNNYYTSEEVEQRIAAANLNNILPQIINCIYPIGALWITTSDDNPGTLFGVGTWEKVSSGRVLEGADGNHAAGSTVEAGLPNITGETITQVNTNSPEGGSTTHVNPVSGAFVSTGVSGTMNGGSAMTSTYYAGNFNASRSSSVYGNSSTVQPSAYFVNIWKRVTDPAPVVTTTFYKFEDDRWGEVFISTNPQPQIDETVYYCGSGSWNVQSLTEYVTSGRYLNGATTVSSIIDRGYKLANYAKYTYGTSYTLSFDVEQ